MEKEVPLVTVIISAYNVEAYVTEAVQSILNQTYSNIEVLIADDASKDNTKSTISSIADKRVHCHHNETNLGYLKTWNKLLSIAKGRYITFQDADDVSHPQRIEKLVAYLDANPGIGLCGSNFIRFFKSWGLYSQSVYPLTEDAIRKSISNGIVPFSGTRVMIRREVYETVGGFREYFHGLTWEDYDWILRVMEKFSVANIPDVLYEYRYFARSQSKQGYDTPLRKLLVQKIGFFLADQRRKDGRDALDKNDINEIEEYIKADIEILKKNKYIKFYRITNNLISNKDFKNAFRAYQHWVRSEPLSYSVLRYGFAMTLALCRTIVKSCYFKITGRDRYSMI